MHVSWASVAELAFLSQDIRFGPSWQHSVSFVTFFLGRGTNGSPGTLAATMLGRNSAASQANERLSLSRSASALRGGGGVHACQNGNT
jgi:hypothetical protein